MEVGGDMLCKKIAAGGYANGIFSIPTATGFANVPIGEMMDI